jgi:hypothetical protein
LQCGVSSYSAPGVNGELFKIWFQYPVGTEFVPDRRECLDERF